MNVIKRELGQWRFHLKGDILAGIVSAFSVIPEVIGFTIVAGVPPIYGLYTSIAFLILLSFIGGRPAMVSAGAGSMAVVVVTLIAEHGTAYLFWAVLLAGIFQIVLGLCRVGNLMRYVPAPVMAGFVDALAIIIFKSQITSLLENTVVTTGGIGKMVLFIGIALAVIYLFPKISTAVPSTLVALILVTAVSVVIALISGGNSDVRMIADLGNLKGSWPGFHLPAAPFNRQTLGIIFPYALSLAFVGLLETMLTNQVVDEMTKSESNKNRECVGQGIVNIICGLVGAMPGCAMIGQAITNVKSGGRGRMSTFVAGVILTFLLAVGSVILGIIPLAALIGVMIFVSITTFNWKNLIGMFSNRSLKGVFETIVTIMTVVVTVASNNLAYGVGIGIGLYILLYFLHRYIRLKRMR
ncbi:SulP family inorganic anion transporter [Eubacterium oxidoreducens]|nr:SulP family inorganic anion transporter [Eubacterium oxidoreducens]